MHAWALDVIVKFPFFHDYFWANGYTTIIAVKFHVIPHVDTDELKHACVSHYYLFGKYMLIRKVTDHQYLL